MSRAIAAAALGVLLGACSGAAGEGGSGGIRLAAPASSPEVFGTVSDFRFTERSGEEVTNADLAGDIWLAGFVFTRCSSICPAMTAQMARAQDMLRGTDARIVSISIDPEHDTPEVLAEYAREVAGADPERWWFLSGEEGAVEELVTKSFMLPIARDDTLDPGEAITHSSILVVVDGEGGIRGFYNCEEEGGTERAVTRIRYLAGERPSAPLRNATLNGIAGVLLVLGQIAIKGQRKVLHGWLMRLAFLASAAFLVSYLHYHFVIIPAQGGPVRFGGEGLAKGLYLALLLTHVVGAVVNLPMVLTTLWLAHKERWQAHKRWARRTWPLWLYVSVTGVAVYVVLYPLNPANG